MTRSDQPAVDDIVERLRIELAWRQIGRQVISDAINEIELLRTALNVAAGEISRAELFWNMTPNEYVDRYIHIAQTIIELDGPTRIGGPQ